MNNIEGAIIDDFRKAIKSPQGTIEFRYKSELLNPLSNSGVLLEVTSGGNIMRLERTKGSLLEFRFATSGTGTKLAIINLKEIPFSEEVWIALCRSPEKIYMCLGTKGPNGVFLNSINSDSEYSLKVDDAGVIYAIGDINMEIMNLTIHKDGKKILSPTALETRNDTKEALKILETGKSEEGYVYDVILCNTIISILITGFEVYMKERVLELDKTRLSKNVEDRLSKTKMKNYIEKIKEEALKNNSTLLSSVIQQRLVNFQNYGESKDIFKKVFNISFSNIGVESKKIEEMKKIIDYRHKVIHVSALSSIFNEGANQNEDIVFVNKELSQAAISVFDNFITKLHIATLKIK